MARLAVPSPRIAIPSPRLTLAKYADTYSRPDAAVLGSTEIGGAAWNNGGIHDTAGTAFGVGSGLVVYSGGAVTDAHAWIETGLSDCVIDVDLPVVLASFMGIVFRRVDGENYYAFRMANTGNNLQLYKLIGGVGTIIIQQVTPFTVKNNIIYHMSVILSGTRFFGLIDGVILMSAILPAGEVTLTGTKHGIYTSVSPNERFDNFAVSSGGIRIPDRNYGDTFTRADSALTMGSLEVGGVAWSYGSQADDASIKWGIQSNKAYLAAATGGINDPHAYHESNLRNGIISVDWTANVGTQGILFRRLDSQNYYAMRVNAASGVANVELFRNLATVRTTIKAADYAFTVGNTYTLTVKLDGNFVQFYINGVWVLTAQILPIDFGVSASKHGLYAISSSANANAFDNYVFSRYGKRSVS